MYKINSKIVNLFFNLCLLILFSAKSSIVTATVKAPSAALVINLSNNKIIFASDHLKRIYPASLAKLMTLHILFSELDKGSISMSTKFVASSNAAKKPASKLYLTAGEKITVHDAILGLIVKSANDVAVVVAENIAGSEEKFSKKMNIAAKKLGMRNTKFQNASGLHHVNQYSTAYDMLKLTKALRQKFPQYYHFFSKTSFSFKGNTIYGHNKLTSNYPGAEGLKTGYTGKSGFNLITVAKRNGNRVAAIVVGENSSRSRDTKMEKLLDNAFTVLKPNKPTYSVSKAYSDKHNQPDVFKVVQNTSNSYKNKVNLAKNNQQNVFEVVQNTSNSYKNKVNLDKNINKVKIAKIKKYPIKINTTKKSNTIKIVKTQHNKVKTIGVKASSIKKKNFDKKIIKISSNKKRILNNKSIKKISTI